MSRIASSVLAAALLSFTAATASARDVCAPVMEWNAFALAATVTANQGAAPQIRSLAIVHASMHDALNTITGEYATYLPAVAATEGASADAAVIAAAHRSLRTLFGATQGTDLDAKRDASLGACGLSNADPGMAVGEAAALAILRLRSTDGASSAQFPYVAPGAGLPGVWQQDGPPAALPGWKNVVPWVLESGSQFRPDAPPALDSGRYARDFNEVKALGSLNDSARTWEQTEIAKFWDSSPSAIWNGVARDVIQSRGLNPSSAIRALALMYIAGADASIACWDAKYTYNFWRPIAAIRRADEDGNEETLPQATWQPLLPTHPHPEYPSGHSTNSSAMATVLTLLFGNDPGVPIVVQNPRNPAFPRNWTTFSEGVDEVIDARVYIGFHFRTSDEVGARLGRQVAHFVVNHTLR